MVAIGDKWSGQILAVCSTLFPLCHIMIRKKCFDLFDRVEGELRKEIHVPWLFTLLYVVFSCVLVSFPYGVLGLLLFIPVLCLHSYFKVHRIASKSVY